MADLWTKKKKILTRKERFKITDDLSKYKEENTKKLQTEKEEFYQQLQAEEKQQHALAQHEHDRRVSTLSFICERFREFHKTTVHSEVHSRNNFIRSQYPQLENLNRIVPWFNELISEWTDRNRNRKQHSVEFTSMIDECIGILAILNMYLENPIAIEHLENWYECERNIRSQLYKNLDAASHSVLTDIEKKMSYLNADIMIYNHKCEFFIHSIWTVLDTIRNTKDEKFPLHCHFELCGIIVHLPKTFAYKAIAVRCLIMLTDYFTSDCRTAAEFELPKAWRLNLVEHVQQIWKKKQHICEQMEQEKATLRAELVKRDSIMSKIRYLVPSSASESITRGNETASVSAISEESGITDLSYLTKIIDMKKSYAEEVLDEDKREIEDIKEYYKMETEKHECNMRKYHIVGGVYHINVVKQPSQPKMLKDDAVLRVIIGEDSLQMWPYFEVYDPPTTKNGLLKQFSDNGDKDAENTSKGVSKLIHIVIKLPDYVLWFDTPTPTHWDYEKRYWSTEYIYEVKFNEEKQTLSFRAGKMTSFGLAVFKFNNLPFQSWELKPRNGDSTTEITFTLTTAILAMEFIIGADKVTLTMLENANTGALQELVGIAYKPRTLLRLLRTGGVNIFPSSDAFQYTDGVQIKHRATEDHLYHCMALLCLCYRFSWSRWNLMCGYKKFVLQLRDAHTEKGHGDLLLVTDQRALITESTDVNQAFAECENTETNESCIFHSDLWSLATDRGGERLQAITDNMDIAFIETVYFMLSQTKIMSYS